MEDAELNAIRAARLQEMQKAANGVRGGAAGGVGNGQGSAGEPQSDAHVAVLAQVLEPEARERLSRVRIVRPDRAQSVEDYIIKMAKSGQLRKKVGEEELVQILDGVSRDQQKQQEGKIIFNRRHLADESEDEDDFFD